MIGSETQATHTPLHIETPLVKSHSLSKKRGFEILLKLDNTQEPGSFKIRGIGNMCASKLKENPNATCFVCASGGNAGLAAGYAGMRLGLPVHVFVPDTTPESVTSLFQQYEGATVTVHGKATCFVCASGGNAGLAAGYAGMRLGLPVHVFVPDTTPESVTSLFQQYEGATVTVHGKVFDEANQRAIEYCESVNGIFIHPFNDPSIWVGNSSIVSELEASFGVSGTVPSCIVVSVGGGGLLLGVMEGVMQHKAWNGVPILAMETVGADCLNKSIKAGRSVRLEKISSIAKSLGSLEICPEVLKRLNDVTLLSEVVSDNVALAACRSFAEDHRYLVEPACGAALAAVYGDVLRKLDDAGKVRLKSGPVVVIVCGGVSTSMVWQK